MLTSVVITSINHVLRSERWACKRLQSFTGKTACIHILPLINCKILINSEGEVQPASNNICADTILTISPFVLPRLLVNDSTALKLIKIIGNKSFADELIDISKHINFSLIFEDDLSSVMGDIPAHRITQAGENIIQWQAENFNRMFQALAEYWTEENLYLTKSTAINKFIQEVKNLQLNTEQLEQRLDRLIQQDTLANN